MRKILLTGTEFDGPVGTNQIDWKQIVKGWPAAITTIKGELETIPAGQTEKGHYKMVCPYKILSDGNLIVKARDIVLDMSTGLEYLVIRARDPMNTKLHIICDVEQGTVQEDFTEQN